MCANNELAVASALLLDNVNVAFNMHFEAAARRLCYNRLKVLSMFSDRWNPSDCIDVLSDTTFKKVKLYSFDSNPNVLKFKKYLGRCSLYHRIRVVVFQWCKHRHIPVRRWHSQSSLHQVCYKGVVDRNGGMHGRGKKHRVACTGKQTRRCNYEPLGSLPKCCSNNPSAYISHSWMCNWYIVLVSH